MKTDKKKVVFILVIALTLLCMVAYYFLVLDQPDADTKMMKQTAVPSLIEEQKTYKSKLEAVDDLKEKKQSNAPSIYDEKLLDSSGVFDPDLLEKRREFVVDSIYRNSRISYGDSTIPRSVVEQKSNRIIQPKENEPENTTKERLVTGKEMALEQQLFFASNPKTDASSQSTTTALRIPVVVNGDHMVMANDRIELRAMEALEMNSKRFPKNTMLYGIVKIGANRVFLDINNINNYPISLKAYDLQDGREGIYIKNTFRAEVREGVIEDAIQDINVPGIPQVKGVKQLFQRSNRRVKVPIHTGYQLVLSTPKKM